MSNVKKNFLYNIAYQILLIIMPIITAPYISRVLGTEKVGIYSYTYSVVYYFMLISMLGLNNYGNRQIARVKGNKKELSQNFYSIYLMQLITTLIAIVFYILYLIFVVKANKIIAIVQILFLLSAALDINWFFFGMEKFKLTVTRNIAIKIVTFVCIFLFVKTETDLPIYTFIMACGTFFSQLLLWPFVKKEVDFCKVSFKDIGVHFKPCLVLFIPVIAVSLYKVMDKIMLGNMTNMDEVGLYESAEKIVNILIGLITSLGTVMLPRMSSLIANGEIEKSKRYIEKSLMFTMFFSGALSFGIMAIAEKFSVLFFGASFASTGMILKYLAITNIFISIANVIRTQYIIPCGRDVSYIISVSLGAVVNLIANFILIPMYQGVGAAIGTILAEFIVMIYQIFDVRKGLSIFRYLLGGIKYLIIGFAMYILLVNININLNNEIINVGLKVLIGGIFYLSVSVSVTMIKFKEFNIFKLYKKILDE